MVKKQRRVRFSKKNQTRVFETTPDEAFNRGYFIRCMDLREQKKNYTHQKQTIRELQQKTQPEDRLGFLSLLSRKGLTISSVISVPVLDALFQ